MNYYIGLESSEKENKEFHTNKSVKRGDHFRQFMALNGPFFLWD